MSGEIFIFKEAFRTAHSRCIVGHVFLAINRCSQPVYDQIFKSMYFFVAFDFDPFFPTVILIFQRFGKAFHPPQLLIIAIVLQFNAANKITVLMSCERLEVPDKRITLFNLKYNTVWHLAEQMYRNVEDLAIALWFLEMR